MRSGAPLVKPPRFAVKQDRNVRVKDVVPCPDCKAPIGSFCTRVDGTASSGHLQHPSRRRMAVRADNLARGI